MRSLVDGARSTATTAAGDPLHSLLIIRERTEDPEPYEVANRLASRLERLTPTPDACARSSTAWDAILLAIALVTLRTRTLLGSRERARVGILKAIGSTPRQLVGGVAANQLVLTVVALAVGIPLGRVVPRSVRRAKGSTEGMGTPALWQLVFLCPLAAGAFAPLAAATALLSATETPRQK